MSTIATLLFLCLLTKSIARDDGATDNATAIYRLANKTTQVVSRTFTHAYKLGVLDPARFFYVWFPVMPGGLGGWGGLSAPEICTALTGIRASHWTETKSNRQECESHLDRRAFSFVVALAAAGYMYLLISTWRALVWSASRLIGCLLDCARVCADRRQVQSKKA